MENQTPKRKLIELKDDVRSKLRYFMDFPKPGIKFVDIMGLMRYPKLIDELCEAVAEHVRTEVPVKIDAVVALESRGFLFGPQISVYLNVPFVPIRKKGKLPGPVITETYIKEYAEDVIEVQNDSLKAGDNVLLVDDLLATGGSLCAAIKLIEKLGAIVAEAFTIVELLYLNPRIRLPAKIPIQSLIGIEK